jgi:hypothetical protein
MLANSSLGECLDLPVVEVNNVLYDNNRTQHSQNPGLFVTVAQHHRRLERVAECGGPFQDMEKHEPRLWLHCHLV